MQVSFGYFSKKRNSTKQPSSLSDVRDVRLKDLTNTDSPTFILTGNNFDYNYCQWGTSYYFINDIKSVHNNLVEVDCILDVLATYKAEILASTQFVSYSSYRSSIWLPDTRIPQLSSEVVSQSVTSLNFLFTDAGFYVLSVVGKDGCDLFMMDNTKLDQLLDRVSDWSDDLLDDVMNGNYPWGGSGSVVYDFTTPEAAIESMGKMNALTGIVGNAYSDAPNCIRSCIWVPFFASFFTNGSGNIYLGQFDTTVSAFRCTPKPITRTATVNIPWQHNDFRRATCEEVYIYIPLVGMVNIPSDEIVNESAINIEWSATATDGCIAFRLTAGNQVIGTYGANASVNVPLGISQQASAGQIVQSAFQGAAKTISSGVSAVSSAMSGDIGGAISSGVDMHLSAIQGAYDTINTAMSRHNTCIGGIGGGAGAGLSLDCKCFTVNHETVISPDAMQATMGLPTMQPMSLSALTGFCQCANAHVEAAAHAEVLDAIDSYLNSGFYIE